MSLRLRMWSPMATSTSAQRPVGDIDLAFEEEPEKEEDEKQKELFVVGRGVKECTPCMRRFPGTGIFPGVGTRMKSLNSFT
jgi:hypothetical protein